MRVVEAASGAVAFPSGAFPSGTKLGRVRDMGGHFPGLRPVAVVRAEELDVRADRSGKTRVWLALEALQVTGSFKVRGALVALVSQRGACVVTASQGNHGIGVAYAAHMLGLHATVFVPRSTPATKCRHITRWGAELVVVGSDRYEAAEQGARRFAETTGAPFLSPSDEAVVLGNGASIGFELVDALRGIPERVLVPLGGGGLATGLAWALAEEGAEPTVDRPVWGVQSEQGCAVAMALAGKTSEDGEATACVERIRAAIGGVLLVRERAIDDALDFARRELGMTLEANGALGLAPLFCGLPERLCGGDVVALLTGRNVDAVPVRTHRASPPPRAC